MNLKKIKSVPPVVLFILAISSGCAAKKPFVAESFVFTPPSSVAATKSGLSVAILRPLKAGSYFLPTTPFTRESDVTMAHMLEAVETDTERSLIAKGFTTTGKYVSADEMTFAQKENAHFLLKQKVTVDTAVNGSQVVISGNVVLELLESRSRTKLWIKHLEIAPVSGNVEMIYAKKQTPAGELVKVVSPNSVTELLNAFYKPLMQKIWDQLDVTEIENLKSDLAKFRPNI